VKQNRLSPPSTVVANEPGKPASIYDVAKKAGVSIKTVSRVVNRQSNVSDATRTRVLDAVKALSYRPNVFARGLASEHSFLIGMLYDNPTGSYIPAVQIGVVDRCRDEGYHLIVEQLDLQDPNLENTVYSLVMESSLHGVILTPPLCDTPAVLEALIRAHIPFVRIAPEKHIAGAADIGIDDRKAAFDMTAYLIGLGHRRIGFIKGKPDHGAAMARFEGYRTALAQAGIPFVEEICVQGFFSYQSGMQACERLLTLKRRPTAIFAANDDMAAAVLATSQRFSLRVPQQLSVAGFDDSLVAQVVWPRLTTCRQPLREMAAAAVSILVQRTAGDGDIERRLEHELIVRESTAAPGD
jgi:LacI family transcriptional regulator